MAGGNDRDPGWLTAKNWKPKHAEILCMIYEGMPTTEIAESMGVSLNTIQRVTHSDLFKQKLGLLQKRAEIKITSHITIGSAVDDARKLFSEKALEIAQTMLTLAQNGGTSKIQYMACKDILDRAGLKPIEIVETRDRVFSPAEVVHAKAVLDEAQAVITRLRTQPSPFIRQVSSATDQGSNGKHDAPEPAETIPAITEQT